MKLFSGTSNPILAQAVAKKLHIPLGKCEITRFIDNECRVYVEEPVDGADVVVFQSLSEVADQNLMELCLLGQALKSLKASTVTAVIPWMGYSKQDRAFRKGEAVSAQLVARFIETAGFDRVITCELHSEKMIPYFRIPVVELSTEPLLAGELPRKKCVVVSPDSGGKSRSEKFAKGANLPIVYLDKSRNLETGEVKITGMKGKVTGRDVAIYDDIINTGATAIKTSEYLKKNGAGKIIFVATHAVLAGDAAFLLAASRIDEVVVTDTVSIPDRKKFSKLRIVSVADLVAGAL